MKKILLAVLGVLLLVSCQTQHTEQEPQSSNKVIFGYLQSQFLPEYQIPWDQLTHLSMAFGRVSEEGNLLADGLRPLTATYREGQAKGVKILMSVGGGSSKTMSAVLQNETYRARLVKQLIEAVEEMGLDGLDIDYEEWTGGPGGTGGEEDTRKVIALETFYKELREALPEGKLLTAAVSAGYEEWNDGWGNYNVFRNSMFDYLDLVNVMVYDFTGKWRTSLVAQHAGWDHFVAAAHQWSVIREVPKEKIILGVPFYGVEFPSLESPVGATHIPYIDILAKYPDDNPTEKDQIGLLFYNGRPTMKQKSQFVVDNGYGGIMIWALSHDPKTKEESLLQVIYDTLNEN